MQEFRTLKTPVAGKEIVIRNWITGRQRRQIDNAALSGMNVTLDSSGQPVIPNIDSTVAQKVEDESIKVVIDSVDGSKKDILERVLDLQSKDYEFVLKEINKTLEGITEEKKS